MFAENNHSVGIYSSYSVTTVQSTVVLLKSKRSFCKSLVATKLLGKPHSAGDMFSLSSFKFGNTEVEAVPCIYIRAGRNSFSRTFKNWAFNSVG